MHDVLTYHGAAPQPTWNPSCAGFEPKPEMSLDTQSGIFILDNVLSEAECLSLIDQFEQQEAYPVGIDGYSNGDPAREGSRRAMAWATDLARKFNEGYGSEGVFGIAPEGPNTYHGILSDYGPDFCIEAPFTERWRLLRLGTTPWMRFMRYRGGGMHVPHYDAPFRCQEENYITLFSWVLYLNTVPRRDGGTFEFVDDGRRDPVSEREPEAFQDWTRMATDEEVILTIHPRRGRMLIFPHWLCHQVNEYTGEDARYIIRGDLAYGIFEST